MIFPLENIAKKYCGELFEMKVSPKSVSEDFFVHRNGRRAP
jgi:hypothetical protein